MTTGPCDRNCKDRVSKIEDDGRIINCHTDCESYIRYRKEKEEEYARRAFVGQKCGMISESIERMKRIQGKTRKFR